MAVLAPTAGASSSAGPGTATATKPPRKQPSIYHSPLLWATINACNPTDHPGTVGVRGSMPGDGRKDEKMYMRFRLQYLDPNTHQWQFVSQNADSGFLLAGSARYRALQSGRSFQIVATPGQPYQLRGAVTVQWRRGRTVVRSARIHTTAGHRDAQGGDPKGFSAGTCTI